MKMILPYCGSSSYPIEYASFSKGIRYCALGSAQIYSGVFSLLYLAIASYGFYASKNTSLISKSIGWVK